MNLERSNVNSPSRIMTNYDLIYRPFGLGWTFGSSTQSVRDLLRMTSGPLGTYMRTAMLRSRTKILKHAAILKTLQQQYLVSCLQASSLSPFPLCLRFNYHSPQLAKCPLIRLRRMVVGCQESWQISKVFSRACCRACCRGVQTHTCVPKLALFWSCKKKFLFLQGFSNVTATSW